MGITLATAEFLAEAAAGGVSFERTLTIGRQHLLVRPARIWPVLQKHGLQPEESRAAFRRQLGWEPWADPLFKLLGARQIESMDTSTYEGASIIHDLNEPIPSELHERFDLVVDGGALEHIFNVAVALKSYMEMVRVGGHLIVISPANNMFGHGFYQFSAEFFYSALSEQNGYAVERMLIYHDDVYTWYRLPERLQGSHRMPDVSSGYGPRYEVADPRVVRERVELQRDSPNLLMVQAKRTSRKPVFESSPQESDYVSLWEANEAALVPASAPAPKPTPAPTALIRLRRRLPESVRLWLRWEGIPRIMPLLDPVAGRRDRRRRSVANQRLFRRLD